MTTHPEHWELLTTNRVARALGVSRGRVQQMLTEKQLPPPTVLGARFHVWHRSDVEYVRAELAGQAPTRISGLLAPPPRPLERVLDEVREIEVPGDPRPLEVHVRVWHGPAPEGPRTVVVLGEPHRGVPLYPNLDIVTEKVVTDLDRLWVSPGEAVWFHYRPVDDSGRLHGVDNLILRFPPVADPEHDAAGHEHSRVCHFFRCPAVTGAPTVVTPPRPVSIAQVEHVVGAPVEAYPPEAYHHRTITRWARLRQRVDVEHDIIDHRQLSDAAQALLEHLSAEPDSDRRQLLGNAVHLLADELRRRHAVVDERGWRDGTEPVSGSGTRWPRTWAARLVPAPVTASDQALIDAYPEPFTPRPTDPLVVKHPDIGEIDVVFDEDVDYQTMIYRLGDVMRAADRFSDAPRPVLHDAVRTAAEVIHRGHGGGARYCPLHEFEVFPRAVSVVGRHDRAYLAGLRPLDIDEATHSDREQVRTYRILRETLRSRVTDPLVGIDPNGVLVLYSTPAEGSPNGRSGGWFAVEWPDSHRGTPIPAGTRIVADLGPGDRPAYLADPDGTMRLLPDISMFGGDVEHWNVGDDAVGVNALTGAIVSTFDTEDDLNRGEAPAAWITDQLTYLDEEREDLDINTDELRRRYPPAVADRHL